MPASAPEGVRLEANAEMLGAAPALAIPALRNCFWGPRHIHRGDSRPKMFLGRCYSHSDAALKSKIEMNRKCQIHAGLGPTLTSLTRRGTGIARAGAMRFNMQLIQMCNQHLGSLSRIQRDLLRSRWSGRQIEQACL